MCSEHAIKVQGVSRRARVSVGGKGLVLKMLQDGYPPPSHFSMYNLLFSFSFSALSPPLVFRLSQDEPKTVGR